MNNELLKASMISKIKIISKIESLMVKKRIIGPFFENRFNRHRRSRLLGVGPCY